MRARPRHFALLISLALVTLARSTPPVGADAAHALIQGSGSGWSANAVNQWVADVQSSGLQVVYTDNGSAQGRKDFAYRTNDFTVTEIGFHGVDELTGEADTAQGREFAYLPLVAGGTAFPYQIRVHGEMVRNLRLSGRTLALIFTNQITDWSDPHITADNNGVALPSIPIIPVVHSEGSGTTAHLTDWFDHEFPDLYRPFVGHAGLTEYYPRRGNAIAQGGSDQVMNFIASSAANGAIGYDEYSYALGKNYPVVRVGNAGGYFTLPTQYNVAVSLTRAHIEGDPNSPDYLLQDLGDVYRFDDPRVYPLSSYSYLVLPIGAGDPRLTTAKRQTLADFLYYSVCDGQREIGPIGYSPLPINLVIAGFDQIAKLRAADPSVDLNQRDVSTCNNPTFVAGQPERNYLAEIAPIPLDCDRFDQGPCAEGADDAARANANPDSGGRAPTLGPGGSGGATPDGGAATTADAAAAADGGASGAAATTGSDPTSDEAASGGIADVPLQVTSSSSPADVLGPFAILLVLSVVIAPAVGVWLIRRSSEQAP